MTPDQLLERAVGRDPARPLLTYYDDATNERAELSVVTFANWVAKTANLLVDGLGAQPGQRVAVHLPVHWQGAVWLAACWATGLVAVTGSGTDGGVDIAVLPLDPLDPIDGGSEPDAGSTARPGFDADEVVGLGLGPMGLARRDIEVPAFVTLDYDREIHSYGDRFGPRAGDDPSRPALRVGNTLHTAGGLAAATADRVTAWPLPPGTRILTSLPFADLPAILTGLLVPLATDGGTVLCRHPDNNRLATRVASENVTAVTGLPPDVLPGLARVT